MSAIHWTATTTYNTAGKLVWSASPCLPFIAAVVPVSTTASSTTISRFVEIVRFYEPDKTLRNKDGLTALLKEWSETIIEPKPSLSEPKQDELLTKIAADAQPLVCSKGHKGRFKASGVEFEIVDAPSSETSTIRIRFSHDMVVVKDTDLRATAEGIEHFTNAT